MKKRILSGMRPTGKLHLGHYWGVLRNWIELQDEYDCYFMIADWHALTSEWMNPGAIPRNVREIAADWIAAGVERIAADASLTPEVRLRDSYLLLRRQLVEELRPTAQGEAPCRPRTSAQRTTASS